MLIHVLTCLALTAVTLHLFVLPAVDMARAVASSQQPSACTCKIVHLSFTRMSSKLTSANINCVDDSFCPGDCPMIRSVTLNVRFPRFGNNYYVQDVVSLKAPLQLITNSGFDSVLMPQASQHFSNEVVGLNDQFRFLNNILAAHLLDAPQPRGNARP